MPIGGFKMKNARVLFLVIACVALVQSRSSMGGWDKSTDVVGHVMVSNGAARAGTGRAVGKLDGDSPGDDDVNGPQDEDGPGGEVAFIGEHTTALSSYLLNCMDLYPVGTTTKVGSLSVKRTADALVLDDGKSSIEAAEIRSEFGSNVELSPDLSAHQVHVKFEEVCRAK